MLCVGWTFFKGQRGVLGQLKVWKRHRWLDAISSGCPHDVSFDVGLSLVDQGLNSFSQRVDRVLRVATGVSQRGPQVSTQFATFLDSGFVVFSGIECCHGCLGSFQEPVDGLLDLATALGRAWLIGQGRHIDLG